MTSVNVTTTKNTVTVNGETRVVTVKTRGPQGPSLPDGDKGDVTVSSNGTAISINSNAVTSAKIADGAIVDADINASAAIALSKLATGALPTAITVTSANISDLSIVDADISGSAAISLSKLATGALPTAITVTSANISDLSIVNADINASAAIAGTKISPDFGSQNIVTTGTAATGALGVTGNLTVSGTVDGVDVATRDALFGGLTSSSGVLSNGVTATTQSASDNSTKVATTAYTDTAISNLINGAPAALDTLNELAAALNDDAAFSTTVTNSIATKMPLAGGQFTGNVTFSGTQTVDGRDLSVDGAKLDGIETGATADQTKSDIDALGIAASTATTLATARTIAGTSFDGSANIDISYTNLTNKLSVGDGGLTQNNFTDALKTKLDGIEASATADQTAAEIKTLLNSNGIVNAQIDASAAIAGTKISPDFGSQNILTSGNFKTTGNEIKIEGIAPFVRFTETNDNPDYIIQANQGALVFKDSTNAAERIKINSDGHVDITGNLDCNSGLDVTGNITVTGTVDGVDIAALNTTVGNLSLSGSVLADGTTATTQSASDNSTKVATTAYADTAVANLVDSAPGTLNTLNELAAALGDDPNFATTVTNSIATKLPLAGGTLTGDLTISNASPSLSFVDSGENPDYKIRNQDGTFRITDTTNNAGRFVINTDGHIDIAGNVDFGAGIDVTGNITVSGTVDGRDIATDGTKLDGIESNATADQTASDIKTLLNSSGLVNAQIDASAAIAGTKISPDFGSQNIDTSGYIEVGSTSSRFANNNLRFNSVGTAYIDQSITGQNINFRVSNSSSLDTTPLTLNSDGHVDITGNLDVGAGVDITGDLTVSGNMTVSGTTTTIDTTTLTVEDKNIELGKVSTPTDTTADGGGITLKGATDKTFQWLDATDSWTSSEHIALPDSKKLQLGDSQDFKIYHGSGNSIIANSTGYLELNANAATWLKTTQLNVIDNDATHYHLRTFKDNQVELYYDNSKKFETTSDGIDVDGSVTANDIITAGALLHEGDTNTLVHFSAADTIDLKTGGSSRLTVTNTGLALQNGYLSSNGNRIILGDSSGANVNRIIFGNNNDLQIYHDGTNSHLVNNTGYLNIQAKSGENSVFLARDGEVNLYFDGSTKFQTTSDGVKIKNTITMEEASGSEAYQFSVNSYGGLDINNDTTKIAEFTDSSTFNLLDNIKITCGTGSDLEIYHNGSNSFIDESSGTGRLIVRSSGFDIKTESSAETMAIFNKDGAVELYYDNSKKLETTTNGITMSGHIDLPDQKEVRVGGNNDLRLRHDGHSIIQNDESGACLFIASHETQFANTGLTEAQAKFFQDGAVELYYDNSKKFFTISNGVQATNRIIVGEGTNQRGLLSGDQNGVSAGSMSDIPFTLVQNSLAKCRVDGNDFQILNDNGKLEIGASQDLQIYHTGTLSRIDNNTGDLLIRTNVASDVGGNIYLKPHDDEDGIIITHDAGVELYYDGSKKFETQSGGITVNGNANFGDNKKTVFGDGSDLKIYHDTENYIKSATASVNLILESAHDVYIKHGGENMLKCAGDGAVELYYDNSLKFKATNSGAQLTGSLAFMSESTNISILDNGKAKFGNGDDLQIYHDGSHSRIVDSGTGNLILQGSRIVLNNAASSENMVTATENGAVELYYDSSLKLDTRSSGVGISGNLFMVDSTVLYLGSSNDFQLFHDGTNSNIVNSTGTLVYRSDTHHFKDKDNGDTHAKFVHDGAVELYYDNSKKFETTSSGTYTTGNVSLSGNIHVADNSGIYCGTGNDLHISHDGSNSYIDSNTGGLNVRSLGSGANVQIIADSDYMARFLNDGAVELYYDNSRKIMTEGAGVKVFGHVIPSADNTHDLGITSLRWRNIYTNDLNLSNEGGSNDVDGTWGSYTIQEGEESLFLINKRNGKKYKFNLTEVS